MSDVKRLSPTNGKPKRESYSSTNHDQIFLNWKVLVGPTDWEGHSRGIEGVWRYRIHNLPDASSPGLYELGISKCDSKLDSRYVIATYIGQAENVRSRLQSYGRSGAHLCPKLCFDYRAEGTGIFENCFNRGFCIVFRWAPMKDKASAEREEAKLLGTFDYAWNKGVNGSRRCDDAVDKLLKVSSKSRFPSFCKKLLRFGRVGSGVRIDAFEDRKLETPKSEVIKCSEESLERKSSDEGEFCGAICMNGTLCRRKAARGSNRCWQHGDNKDRYAKSCGVTLYDGSFCTSVPVPGRKRCLLHKGIRCK